MIKVRLTCANFSYFAFHHKSSKLSDSDQKIAFVATLLLGLTFGLGHLICAIGYKKQKDRVEALTNQVAQEQLNIPQENQRQADVIQNEAKVEPAPVPGNLNADLDNIRIKLNASYWASVQKDNPTPADHILENFKEKFNVCFDALKKEAPLQKLHALNVRLDYGMNHIILDDQFNFSALKPLLLNNLDNYSLYFQIVGKTADDCEINIDALLKKENGNETTRGPGVRKIYKNGPPNLDGKF